MMSIADFIPVPSASRSTAAVARYRQRQACRGVRLWVATVALALVGPCQAGGQGHRAEGEGVGQEPMCRAQEFQGQVEPMAWPRQQGVLKLDAPCWIAPAQLRQQLAKAQDAPVLLVDVRTHGWRADALEGAIALPLRDLPHQAFLAQGEAVLVGSGLDMAELNQACLDLRRKGWRVKALRGGAPAWLEHRSGLAQAITAQQWIMALGQGMDWQLVLGAALPDEQAEHLPLAPALVLDAKASASAQAAAGQLLRLQQRLQRRASQQAVQAAVVFLAQDDTAAVLQALHAAQQQTLSPKAIAAAAVPIYVVQGGWAAYQAEVLQNQAIHASAQHGLARTCGGL